MFVSDPGSYAKPTYFCILVDWDSDGGGLEDWKYYGFEGIRFMKGPMNHGDAKAYCKDAGGHLVELQSEGKQDVVLYMERYLGQRGHDMYEPIIGEYVWLRY